MANQRPPPPAPVVDHHLRAYEAIRRYRVAAVVAVVIVGEGDIVILFFASVLGRLFDVS